MYGIEAPPLRRGEVDLDIFRDTEGFESISQQRTTVNRIGTSKTVEYKCEITMLIEVRT